MGKYLEIYSQQFWKGVRKQQGEESKIREPSAIDEALKIIERREKKEKQLRKIVRMKYTYVPRDERIKKALASSGETKMKRHMTLQEKEARYLELGGDINRLRDVTNMNIEEKKSYRRYIFNLLYRMEHPEKYYVPVKERKPRKCVGNYSEWEETMNELEKQYILLGGSELDLREHDKMTSTERFTYRNKIRFKVRQWITGKCKLPVTIKDIEDKYTEAGGHPRRLKDTSKMTKEELRKYRLYLRSSTYKIKYGKLKR